MARCASAVGQRAEGALPVRIAAQDSQNVLSECPPTSSSQPIERPKTARHGALPADNVNFSSQQSSNSSLQPVLARNPSSPAGNVQSDEAGKTSKKVARVSASDVDSTDKHHDASEEDEEETVFWAQCDACNAWRTLAQEWGDATFSCQDASATCTPSGLEKVRRQRERQQARAAAAATKLAEAERRKEEKAAERAAKRAEVEARRDKAPKRRRKTDEERAEESRLKIQRAEQRAAEQLRKRAEKAEREQARKAAGQFNWHKHKALHARALHTIDRLGVTAAETTGATVLAGMGFSDADPCPVNLDATKVGTLLKDYRHSAHLRCPPFTHLRPPRLAIVKRLSMLWLSAYHVLVQLQGVGGNKEQVVAGLGAELKGWWGQRLYALQFLDVACDLGYCSFDPVSGHLQLSLDHAVEPGTPTPPSPAILTDSQPPVVSSVVA